MNSIMLTSFVLNSTLEVREDTNLGDDVYMAQDTWTVRNFSPETQVLTALRVREVSVAPHSGFQDWTEPYLGYFTFSEWLNFVASQALEGLSELAPDEYNYDERCPLHRTPMHEDYVGDTPSKRLVCLSPGCDITRPLRKQQA